MTSVALVRLHRPVPVVAPRSFARADALVRVLPLVGAAVLFAVGVAQTNPGDATDVGLISALPVSVWLSFALVVGSFASLYLREEFPRLLAAAHVVMLAVMLFGLGPFADDVARISVTWRHVGIADHVVRHRDVDPRIDAYFNWPGFFVFLGFVARLLDVDLLTIAPWVPIVVNLACVAAIVGIARFFTDDARVVALAAWMFLVANWIAQDYLAPQAIAYLGALVILAVVLHWFGTEAPPAGHAGALKGLVIVVFAGVVVSHQLTPFAVLATVSALVLTRRCTARGLPLVFAAIVATWIAFRTGAFLSGRLAALVGDIGDVGNAAQANVTNRLDGSAGHAAVVRVRLVAAGALWVLAAAGALRWWLSAARRHTVTLLAIVAAPLPLLVFQPYGGEMIQRVQLYALPGLVVLAAAAVLSRSRGRSFVTIVAVTAPLLVAFVCVRYGNERFDRFSADDIAAVRAFYADAPLGATLIAPSGHLPWKAQGYDDYDYKTVVGGHAADETDAAMLTLIREKLRGSPAGCGYVVVTRSEAAYGEMFGAWPRAALARLRSDLAAARDFRPVSRPSAESVLYVTRRSSDDPRTTSPHAQRARCGRAAGADA